MVPAMRTSIDLGNVLLAEVTAMPNRSVEQASA
jgi:hypothetical protein